MKSCIVIPLYKASPEKGERLAFRQCLKVLGKHSIVLVTHRELNLDVYRTIAREENVTLRTLYFEPTFFDSIAGYNRLLLSRHFYKCFKQYEYILIYQLDGFVFRDELQHWIDLGYDYIGAPWFENYGSHETGDKLWKVGNGGMSLRRVGFFLRVLNPWRPLCRPDQLPHPSSRDPLIRQLKGWIRFFLQIFGYRNRIGQLLAANQLNEDVFWTTALHDTRYTIRIPDPERAIGFSFERSPAYLFEKNNGTLPFLCHAFEKHDFESFWKKHIIKNEV